MKELTSRQRVFRMFEHREADRIPIIDAPWKSTLERWQREGLPKKRWVDYYGADLTWIDHFGVDFVGGFGMDNSPRYEEKTIEETEEHKIVTTQWGVTMRVEKRAETTPEYLDFTITDPETWDEAKARIRPEKDRIDWDYLKSDYRLWKEKDYWIHAGLNFGFDVTHSRIIGTERMLMALVEQPEWCCDMFSNQLDVGLALLDMVWEAGYRFDGIHWCDDMGYKNNQFFSLNMYRALLKPFHQKAIDWAHAKGIKAHLHSCGDIRPLVTELVGMGLDALNPLEVKAGMDPLRLKKEYGKELVLHGGINAVLWDKPVQIMEEMERVIPVLRKDGGYIFSSDHSIPSSVGLEDFRRIVEWAKKLGAY